MEWYFKKISKYYLVRLIKLSKLRDDENIITENGTVYSVEDLKNDFEYFKNSKVYTTKEYHASIDAGSIIEDIIENEYQNMYEDWDEKILNDITDEDVEKIQAVFDELFNRNKEQNISYYYDREIDIFS